MTKAEGDNLVIDKADREAEVDSQHETTNKLTVDKGLSRDWVFDMSAQWIYQHL